MAVDLLAEVQAELAARKDEWESIADALRDTEPSVSLSWIEKVGRDLYESSPSYERLRTVHEYLRKHPRSRARA